MCDTEKFHFKEKEWFTPNTYDRNFRPAPSCAGVYLIIDFSSYIPGEILYIGSSKNLCVRYGKHEVLRVLRRDYVYVRFYFKEIENYKEEEIKLIRLVKPRYNTQYNGKTTIHSSLHR